MTARARRALGQFWALAILLAVTGMAEPAASQGQCQFYGACRLCILPNDCASLGGSYADDWRTGCAFASCESLCNRPTTSNCTTAPNDDCDAQDKCDGNGSCSNRYDPAGTACGSPLNDECTLPDTCSGGGGVCLGNHDPGADCALGGCTEGGVCARETFLFVQAPVSTPLPYPFSPGDVMTLEYSFGASTPDTASGAGIGAYPALISATLTVGSTRWNARGGMIFVNDSPTNDAYTANFEISHDPSTPRPPLSFSELTLDLRGERVLESDALPQTPAELLEFSRRLLALDEEDGGPALAVTRIELDACPFYSSANNGDFDGNGIGDECECGDQTEDGTVNVLDLVAINLAIFGAVQVSPLCDTNNDGDCNVLDIVGANYKIFGRPAYCSRYPRPAQP